MARYKEYSYDQGRLIPINFHKQILPGSFEYALNRIVDNDLDLTIFEKKYKNDETGAPAYEPGIMLKIILYAYSKGITSSREIEQNCRENVIFMALSADSKPHYTTIAEFVSSMKEEITPLFRDVLLYCANMKLIDKTMFAIDGCKISSNASKEWSGTRKDYEKKIKKLEQNIKYIMEKHEGEDKRETEEKEKEEKYIEWMRKKIEKVRRFIEEYEDKKGKRGNIKKSNITDNESAKMVSSEGVIQGYNGVAIADSRHQIIVHAEAFGEGSEKELLKPMIEGARENFKEIGEEKDIFKGAKVIGDNGYYNRDNIEMLEEEEIDAYIPDNMFRKRDERFKEADRHKKPIDRKKTKRVRKYYGVKEFKYDEEKKKMICPAGKEMYIKNSKYEYKGSKAVAYQARESDCRGCKLRNKCMWKTTTTSRQVHIFYKRVGDKVLNKMREKIDTEEGRRIYSKRMEIIEPIFGNIKRNKGLNRFSLRGKIKVDIQWKLYAIVHNIGKIFRYGPAFA